LASAVPSLAVGLSDAAMFEQTSALAAAAARALRRSLRRR
jgi:hypothetical protein